MAFNELIMGDKINNDHQRRIYNLAEYLRWSFLTKILTGNSSLQKRHQGCLTIQIDGLKYAYDLQQTDSNLRNLIKIEVPKMKKSENYHTKSIKHLKNLSLPRRPSPKKKKRLFTITNTTVKRHFRILQR